MCTPAAATAVMGTSGAAMSAVGSYNQAQGQQQAYSYQAQVDQQNVTIANEQAKQALAVGGQEEQNRELQTNQTYGAQRAAMSANGIDISSSGSAIDILSTTKYMGDRDVATINDNALRQAWGYSVQATNDQNSANFMNNAASRINPTNAAFGSILGSGAQVAQKWYALDAAGRNTGNNLGSSTGPGLGGLY